MTRMAAVRSQLGVLLAEKGAAEKRRITHKEVAEAAGVSEETVSRLISNQTTRYDASVLSGVCKYLGVPAGQPIPFLVYEPDEATE